MSKKGPKSQPKEQSYVIRDVVLAKVRGFPPWPGMIVDPDAVPKNVTKERPNAKSKKGVWYCVRFFPAGDYAWLVPKDISKLQKHEIQAYIDEPFKKSADLLTGYRIALDPTKWEEEREAASAEAAEEEANAEIDQLDSDGAEDPDAVDEAEGEDDEEGQKKKLKSKKRKRESDAGPVKKAAAKGGRKKDSAEPVGKKKGNSKGKKNGTKSKALVESEDDANADGEEEDAGPSKKASSPPPAKKAKRDKDEDEVDPELLKDAEAQKVREWRHKLQKAFLNTKAQPKDEDMPELDKLFTTVENYDKMSVPYLSFSKIGKVMRHIHALTPERVPRDDEFRFRERANVLVSKWHDIINANKAQANGTTSGDSAKPSANGASETAKKDVKATANGATTSAKEAVIADVDAKGDDVAVEASPEANADTVVLPEANDTTGPGDESILADVTMSEAA